MVGPRYRWIGVSRGIPQPCRTTSAARIAILSRLPSSSSSLPFLRFCREPAPLTATSVTPQRLQAGRHARAHYAGSVPVSPAPTAGRRAPATFARCWVGSPSRCRRRDARQPRLQTFSLHNPVRWRGLSRLPKPGRVPERAHRPGLYRGCTAGAQWRCHRASCGCRAHRQGRARKRPGGEFPAAGLETRRREYAAGAECKAAQRYFCD